MSSSPPGALLRQWRTRRRFSQLDLALAAEVSTKHLSYIETGRARPSPEMVLHLCEHLDIPLKRRNEILLAAGHAPRYGHTVYDPSVDSEVRTTIDQLIAAHLDPTIAVDGDWNLLASNPAAVVFLDGVAPHLLTPPTNVIRMSLHPDGLAARVANFDDYAGHVLARVRQATAASPSATLDQLLDEFGHLASRPTRSSPDIFLTLDLRTAAGVISFFSTITVFGSPRDVALDEVALETFHPADPSSRANLDAALRPHRA
ncbi:MAG: helix-turn-helix transcriptional regulator [Ilumatobacteraceae bacterium]